MGYRYLRWYTKTEFYVHASSTRSIFVPFLQQIVPKIYKCQNILRPRSSFGIFFLVGFCIKTFDTHWLSCVCINSSAFDVFTLWNSLNIKNRVIDHVAIFMISYKTIFDQSVVTFVHESMTMISLRTSSKSQIPPYYLPAQQFSLVCGAWQHRQRMPHN